MTTIDRSLLADVLVRALSPAAIRCFSVQPSRYQSSFPLFGVSVRMQSGEQVRLLLKNLSREQLSAQALLAKPATSHHPLREIEVYRRVLPTDLGTARLLAAETDAPGGRHWLLIEHVRGVELYQVGDLEGWCLAAAWLARMHERLAPLASTAVPAAAHLRMLGHDTWCEALARAAAVVALPFPARRHDHVVGLLSAAPRRIIHGDAYASNILIDRDTDPPRVCAVDWERAAVGPQLLDLATLIAGWPPNSADRIAAAYRNALPARSSLSDPDVFRATLAACTVHVALDMMGSVRGWEPPREHRQDWLAIASGAMDRLR